MRGWSKPGSSLPTRARYAASEHARVGDNHFVAQTLKESTGPWGVGARLEHKAGRRHCPESLLERFGCARDAGLLQHLAILVEHAQMRIEITQIEPCGQFLFYLPGVQVVHS